VISIRPAACVEIGASNVQTVLFEGDGCYRVVEGAHQPEGFELAIGVPGLIVDGIVSESSNLGWRDVDPVEALGLPGPAKVVVNDAEAAGLGESVLRAAEGFGPLVYLGLGTGIGGAVVDGGEVIAGNLFGHMAGFGSARCPCGRTGCLETVAAGWSLPYPIDDEHLARASSALATGITSESLASGVPLVVIGGGIARRYPRLVDMTRAHLNGLEVEPTQAPPEAKSAAAWGLSYLSNDLGPAEPEVDGSKTSIRIDAPTPSRMDT
jgi:predicted NBD/HSP70 family sugar kinase